MGNAVDDFYAVDIVLTLASASCEWVKSRFWNCTAHRLLRFCLPIQALGLRDPTRRCYCAVTRFLGGLRRLKTLCCSHIRSYQKEELFGRLMIRWTRLGHHSRIGFAKTDRVESVYHCLSLLLHEKVLSENGSFDMARY